MSPVMDLTIGQVLTTDRPLRLSKARIAEFSETSGDASIVHLDDQAARDFGFPKALAHGLLGMTLAGRLLTDHFPQSQLGQFSSRFVAMTFVDDVLRCEAIVTEFINVAERRAVELSIKATNQNDIVVMTGCALVTLSDK
jgi:3-hydroxybutyryl-CoA dehydratase